MSDDFDRETSNGIRLDGKAPTRRARWSRGTKITAIVAGVIVAAGLQS